MGWLSGRGIFDDNENLWEAEKINKIIQKAKKERNDSNNFHGTEEIKSKKSAKCILCKKPATHQSFFGKVNVYCCENGYHQRFARKRAKIKRLAMGLS